MSSTRRGAISTPHTLATRAGEDAFRSGGSAIDAAISAAAVLTVVYPNNVALGSDLVALVRNPDGRIRCVNATGYAPKGQNASRLRELYGSELPTRGVDTITVPGAVRGWATMRTLGANLSWASHFDAAVDAARDGVPVARSVAAAILAEREDLVKDPGCRDTFLSDGIPANEGDRLVQLQLSESLTALQLGGPDELYGGGLGQRLVDGLAQIGGVMTIDDFAAFEPEVVEPLRTNFRDYDIVTSPPNTQGFMLLRALRALQELGDPRDILETNARSLVQIFRQGNDVRDAFLADPRMAAIDVNDLINGTQPSTSNGKLRGGLRATGDTVGISAIDSEGYAVSLIQSVYYAFGSAVLEPSTGILMQNRGSSFSLDQRSPNVVEPFKRPRHTLMPVLVTHDDEVKWVSSTMGGQGQPQIHAQVILRSLAGASAQAAVSAPRWIVGAQEDGDTDDTVYLEEDAAVEVHSSLADDEFDLRVVSPHSESLGHANLIRVTDKGHFEAASDPRSDGSAIEVELPEK